MATLEDLNRRLHARLCHIEIAQEIQILELPNLVFPYFGALILVNGHDTSY